MLNEIQPIASRLEAADRACQKEKGGSLFVRSVPWLLGFLLLAFLLDVFLHLDPAPRLLLLGVLALLSLGALAGSFFVAFVRRNQLEHIARVLEERDPALGSKLINVLQLQAQASDPALPARTRQLATDAIAVYAEELRGTPFERLAKTNRLHLDLKRTAFMGLGFLAILGAFYKVSWVEILRFADPFGDHPPYSLTQLEIVEPGKDGAEVTFNKGFLVKAAHSGHRPRELFLTYHPPDQPERAATVPMFGKGDLGFVQQIDGIRSDLVITAHTKNFHSHSKKRRIHVLLAPKLERAHVRVTPPEYTGIKGEERAFRFNNFRALSGSQVQFRLQSNRPLREGAIEIQKSPGHIERVPLTLVGDTEVAGSFTAVESALLRFTLVAEDGIASEEQWEGSITVTHDLSPEIRVTEPSKDCFVSIDFKTEVQIDAADDYGLSTVRIHQAVNQVFSEPKVVTYGGIVRSARETLPLDFESMQIQPGDVISIFAEAIDTAPEANLARSQTVNLMVISIEDYNTFLRQQNDISDIEAKYSELLHQLHELIEEQRRIGQAVEELEKKLASADEKDRPALQQALDGLLARQNELNQKLNKLADQMDQFVRKDPLYDVESAFQPLLAQKAEAIRDSTAANDASARDIAGQSSPPSGDRHLTPGMVSAFKQASEEQVHRLGGIEAEAREEIVEALQDLGLMHELVKNFNRFEQLFYAQQTIAEQAGAYNRPGPLSREDQLALKELANRERQIAEALDQLSKKLSEDAAAADELFPKASASARDLAAKIEELRLSSLARQATGAMLGANGERSFQLAGRLRDEMEKLFSECNAEGSPQMSGELDSYLSLQRGLNPGQTFQQMLQSRKFGAGNQPGFAFGFGPAGQMGSSGFAVTAAPTLDVMGNETIISRSNAAARQEAKAGLGQGQSDQEGGGVTLSNPDVVKGVNPVNRQSEAIMSESLIEEYSEIVDKYFRAITKGP
jgi:hypothetical protein